MNKNKGPRRITIKENLLLDAEEIQTVCGLDNLAAAINMVLALYTKHLLERLRQSASDVSHIRSSLEKVPTTNSASEGMRSQKPTSNLPADRVSNTQNGANLRDFLRAKVKER